MTPEENKNMEEWKRMFVARYSCLKGLYSFLDEAIEAVGSEQYSLENLKAFNDRVLQLAKDEGFLQIANPK